MVERAPRGIRVPGDGGGRSQGAGVRPDGLPEGKVVLKSDKVGNEPHTREELLALLNKNGIPVKDGLAEEATAHENTPSSDGEGHATPVASGEAAANAHEETGAAETHDAHGAANDNHGGGHGHSGPPRGILPKVGWALDNPGLALKAGWGGLMWLFAATFMFMGYLRKEMNTSIAEGGKGGGGGGHAAPKKAAKDDHGGGGHH